MDERVSDDLRTRAELDLANLNRRMRMIRVAKSSRELIWAATTIPFFMVVGVILLQVTYPWMRTDYPLIFLDNSFFHLNHCLIMMFFLAYIGWVYKAIDRRINALVRLLEEQDLLDPDLRKGQEAPVES